MPNQLLLKAVLSQYPSKYRPSMTPVAMSGGFSGASVYRVESAAAGAVCLRAWPGNAPALPPERIRGLHRLLRLVRDHGLTQVAVPIPDSTGQTLVWTGERYWQLEPWMPGIANFHQCPGTARLVSTMQTLARWHRAASAFVPVGAERQWFHSAEQSISPAVQERGRRISEWSRRGISRVRELVSRDSDEQFAGVCLAILDGFERKAAEVLGELRHAADWHVPVQPCLRDIWHDHVLFEGDDVTGIVDPSACRTESVASDLSRLLGSLVGDDSVAWEHALDAYSAVRPLSATEQRLVQVLDRSGVLLNGLTWIERRYLTVAACADWNAVLQRLEAILQRLRLLR